MKKRLLFVFLAGAAVLMSGCTLDHLAGGGTESTNGLVVGTLIDETGKPSGNTVVKLIPINFDPVKNSPLPATMIDTTDEIGSYCFSRVDTGDYNLQAVHHKRGIGGIVQGIRVEGDTVTLENKRLTPHGWIKTALPSGATIESGYVYIPGTSIFAFIDGQVDFVILDSIPSGLFASIACSGRYTTAISVIRYNVSVQPGDTAAILNPSWKYARTLVLNTTASGADIKGNIADFPLLIRLSKINFAFSQAAPSGADLRLTGPANTFLPCEIERWDAENGLAELWVRVDTVRGNDSTQAITMYWGNSATATLQGPVPVFDTATGFAGVWHLGQPAGSIIPDATVNGNNGTAMATTTVPGMIGAAQSFDGVSGLVRTSGPAEDRLNFTDSGTYTVSAWVRSNALDTFCQAIVFKSNAQYGLQIIPEKKWEFATYIEKSRWESSRSPAAAGSWHAVTGVRSGTRQYLFVDGECLDSSITNTPTLPPENGPRAYDQPLEIGHCPDGGKNPDRFFNGVIDEVRISRMAHSADWIKLCYMNQKAQDQLIKEIVE